jgi:tetratricopeptide (TPR) repeat protein
MGRFCVLAIALTLAGTANADPNAGKVKAGELVKQAIAKSQAGDHSSAIELYEQAYMLVPQPLLLSNIGSEYQKSGKKPEAIKYFCKYLAEDPNGGMVEYATAQVKTMQIELGVQTDEKDVCRPKAKPLDPVATNPAPLEPPPPAGPPGGTPATTFGPTGGPVDQGPEAPSQTLEYAGFGVAGVGAIVLGVGVYYGLQAKDMSDKITNWPKNTPWPDTIKAMEQEGKDDQSKQIEFMIAGGAVLGVGVVMAVIGHSHASSAEHVTLRPVATQNTVGLAVGGGF